MENILIHYNPEQKWFYLSNQGPSELLVFRQHDYESKTGLFSLYYSLFCLFNPPKAVPHALFLHPASPGQDSIMRRESIELQALIHF